MGKNTCLLFQDITLFEPGSRPEITYVLRLRFFGRKSCLFGWNEKREFTISQAQNP
jgi:hypothetical protein